MNKYDPLRTHLESQSLAELTLSFRQMEKIVGGPLPTTALRPHWWVNGTTTQKSMRPQVSAWTEAGYDALLIAGRKVRFKRVR